MARQKRAKRSKDRAFQVRITDEMADRFDAMMEDLGGRVKGATGRELSRTDLVENWIAWLLSLPPDQQDGWARTYRTAFVASLDRPRGSNPGPIHGPDVTIDLDPPKSGNGPAKEDDHATKRKPAPPRAGRK